MAELTQDGPRAVFATTFLIQNMDRTRLVFYVLKIVIVMILIGCINSMVWLVGNSGLQFGGCAISQRETQ